VRFLRRHDDIEVSDDGGVFELSCAELCGSGNEVYLSAGSGDSHDGAGDRVYFVSVLLQDGTGAYAGIGRLDHVGRGCKLELCEEDRPGTELTTRCCRLGAMLC
jgi:hypothetical protein